MRGARKCNGRCLVSASQNVSRTPENWRTSLVVPGEGSRCGVKGVRTRPVTSSRHPTGRDLAKRLRSQVRRRTHRARKSH